MKILSVFSNFLFSVECKISVDETNVLSVVVPRVILMLLERERMKSVHILPTVSFNLKKNTATIISHFGGLSSSLT